MPFQTAVPAVCLTGLPGARHVPWEPGQSSGCPSPQLAPQPARAGLCASQHTEVIVSLRCRWSCSVTRFLTLCQTYHVLRVLMDTARSESTRLVHEHQKWNHHSASADDCTSSEGFSHFFLFPDLQNCSFKSAPLFYFREKSCFLLYFVSSCSTVEVNPAMY